jgi:hypothetical protein
MSDIHRTNRRSSLPLPANSSAVANELQRQHMDRALDEALMESFPASDPIAVSFDYVIDRARFNTRSRPY